MRLLIKQMKTDLKTTKGVPIQIEVPRSIYHRVQTLAINDSTRSDEKIYYRDKVLEALVTGIEALETQERQIEVD